MNDLIASKIAHKNEVIETPPPPVEYVGKHTDEN